MFANIDTSKYIKQQLRIIKTHEAAAWKRFYSTLDGGDVELMRRTMGVWLMFAARRAHLERRLGIQAAL
jgi:hypothetical protein